MFSIECRHRAAPLQGSRRDDQIIVTGHFSRSRQFRPKAGVFVCGFFGVRDDRQRRQNCLQIPLSTKPLPASRPFNAIPKFGDGNGGDFKLIVPGGQPSPQVKRAFLTPDDDVRVEDYRHLSSRDFNRLRAASRSLRHARASAFERPIPASTAASSLPAHRFSTSGTSRANGLPFFNRRKLSLR